MAAITVRMDHQRDAIAATPGITSGLPGRDVIVATGHVPLTITDEGQETEAVVVMRDSGQLAEEVQARPVAILSFEHGDTWQAAVLCVADNLQAAGTESASLGQVRAVLDEAFEAYLHLTGCPD